MMKPDPKAPGAQELRCLISTARHEAKKSIGREATDEDMLSSVWEAAMIEAFKLGQVNPHKPPVPFPIPFDPMQAADAMNAMSEPKKSTIEQQLFDLKRLRAAVMFRIQSVLSLPEDSPTLVSLREAVTEAFALGQFALGQKSFPLPFDPEQEAAEAKKPATEPERKRDTIQGLVQATTAAMSDWIGADMGPEDKEYVLKQHADYMRHAYGLGAMDEAKKEDGRLKTVLQHALNVLVGFQLWAKGRTVFMGEDERTAVYANDLETATSVAELTKLARLAECEGLDLLPKPADPPELNVLSSGDVPLARGGGIFDG